MYMRDLVDSHTFIHTSLFSLVSMPTEETSINVKEPIRDELRRYKAQDGLTYDEAIARLLETAGWISDEEELLEELKQ